MKKLLTFAGLFLLPWTVHAGTITTSFLNSAGSITISSNAAVTHSPLTFVQVTSTATSDGGCGSVLNTITVTAGNLLVLGCATFNNLSGITPSDASDTWLTAGTVTGGSAGYFVGIYYVKSAVGGTTTVTAATNGCNGPNTCVLEEYSGQNTSSTFDVFSGSAPLGGSTLNPITTLSTTTTGTNELMFSFAYMTNGTVTAQTGTPRYSNQNNPGWFSQDANIPTAQAYVSTWTITSPFSWLSAEAAFNPK